MLKEEGVALEESTWEWIETRRGYILLAGNVTHGSEAGRRSTHKYQKRIANELRVLIVCTSTAFSRAEPAPHSSFAAPARGTRRHPNPHNVRPRRTRTYKIATQSAERRRGPDVRSNLESVGQEEHGDNALDIVEGACTYCALRLCECVSAPWSHQTRAHVPCRL